MATVKYTFDNDFEDDTDSGPSQKKMTEVRAQAFAEGQEAGRAEILSGLEQSSGVLLDNICRAVENLVARHDEQVALLQKESAKLALAIISRLAPALVEKTPLVEVEKLVEQCLKDNPLEPRLTIRVDAALIPLLEPRLNILIETNHFSGTLHLVEAEMTHISDCRVEWTNGGVERNFTGLMNSIEDLIELFLKAPDNAAHRTETGSIDTELGQIAEVASAE